MNIKLRSQSLRSMLPVIICFGAAVYILSLWSMGLALSIGLSAQIFIVALVIAKAQRSTVRAQDIVFKQYECLKQLYHALSPKKPLPTTRGYAASPDFLMEVYKKIIEKTPKVIVEGSSGLSTLVCSYAAKQVGNCEVFSLEHDEFYSKISQNYLEEHELTQFGHVYHAPILSHNLGKGSWLWYDYKSVALPENIDLVIIDGPPKRLQKHARYPALPLLIDRMSVGGVLLMDDADRKQEMQIVEMWKEEFKNISVEYVPLEKGMVAITKLRN